MYSCWTPKEKQKLFNKVQQHPLQTISLQFVFTRDCPPPTNAPIGPLFKQQLRLIFTFIVVAHWTVYQVTHRHMCVCVLVHDLKVYETEWYITLQGTHLSLCSIVFTTVNVEHFLVLQTHENIVIQLGKARDSIVATHFPCTCIRSCQSLIISGEPEKVEVAQDQFYKPIQSRDKYSVFYIDTVGGKYTKQKKLFRNNAVKEFKYLCVYGEKGMTVKECLKRDGRFIDDLDNFTLSDNADPDSITECTQKVDNLHEKQFKICLPRNNKRASSERQQENSELMESRFPDHSYQEALNLRKENFGKIQQSFSEVHRVRKLLKLGESVCKVVVKNVCQGTGFVLFDNFILTNAHLFKGCIEGQKLKEGIDVPPGLLKIFGLMPRDGEACIIGHPAVRDHLHPYKDSIVTLLSINKEGTYNTFMYHGSSGSPVFDAHGRVFGLHTAGYAYGFPNQRESVIEFAQPLLTIFKHFVSMLKVSGQDELLNVIVK
uniref:Serine protease n=1 Tax=Sander lucioperca TaxID=283035 RepID=A0A8D0CUM5_SANLU